jgi:hypothetical protein
MTVKRCLRGHDVTRFGRDSSGRCRKCKAEAMWAARAPQREAAAAARAERQAAREAEARRILEEADRARRRAQEEAEARREAKYRRAIKAGGDVALEARWWRLDSETDDKYAGRYALCQWATDSGGLGGCFSRTTGGVYCAKHNAKLDREIARERREREAAP